MENESQAGPVDLDAIQAHLDMTMALTFDMVQSAMGRKPSDSLEVVVDPWAVREPRLGVGSPPPKGSGSLARETARLQGRLLNGTKRKRDESETTPMVNGTKRPKRDDESGSDQEDSRATAVTGKAKSNLTSDKFALPTKKKAKTPKANPFSLPTAADQTPLITESTQIPRFATPSSPFKGPLKSPTNPYGSPSRESSRGSPVVSLASSTSKQVRRLLMKQDALESLRKITVVEVSTPDQPSSSQRESPLQSPVSPKQESAYKPKTGATDQGKPGPDRLPPIVNGIGSRPVMNGIGGNPVVNGSPKKSILDQSSIPTLPSGKLVLQLEPIIAAPDETSNVKKKKKRRRKKKKREGLTANVEPPSAAGDSREYSDEESD